MQAYNSTIQEVYMRRWFVLLGIIVLVIIVAILGFEYYRNYKNNKPVTNTTTQKSEYKNINFEVVSEWDKYFQLHVMYPQTENANINKDARQEIDKYVNPFRKLISTNSKKSERPLDLNITSEVNFANDYAINFIYKGSQYNGTQQSLIETNQLYNRQTGQVIPTSQLFSNPKYLNVLSQLSLKALPSILKNDYNDALATKGTAPKSENFQNFDLVDDKTINIIFEPGQVANESVGIVKAPIQIELIDDYFNDAEINKFFPDYLTQLRQQKLEDLKRLARQNLQNIPPISIENKTDCKVKKCIALTFDDGPSGSTTQSVLDTLNQNGAKATFFMIGRQIPAQASIVKSIANTGHEIGNHTWDHIDMAYADAPTLKDQISKTSYAMVDVLGKRPVLVRPPYGSFKPTTLQTVAQPFIIWSVDPKDWQDKNADTVYQRVMSNAQPGAIVLSHDIHPTTAEAYKRIIPELKAKGYTFVTISDLLNIDSSNPAVKSYNLMSQ